MNRNRGLIYGIGINDADYTVYKRDIPGDKTTTLRVCPFYQRWCGMLRRCYSSKFLLDYPTYVGCLVIQEWLLFSNFKAWMVSQPWEGKELDKDILVPGNKVYGPDTCVFIDARINTFIGNKRGSEENGSLIGVSFDSNSGKYKAECRDVVMNKSKHLGLYNDPKEGHKAWLKFKLEQARILAKEQTDERVAKALIDRYENYGNLPKDA
jgi:hypothetical protein